MTTVTDLGCISNVEVIERFVSINGMFVVDVGCGNLTFTSLLSGLGAKVLAIDPDPVQAELNRASVPIPNIQFVETVAEQLPVKNQSVDGVFLSYSLHHIPAETYPQLFDEILRVLKPSGFLYVIEPIDCPINEVMRLFHNEDKVRALAWEALEQFSSDSFESSQTVEYHSFSQYESFDDFAQQYAGRSFNSLYTEAEIRNPVVQQAFERLGAPDYRFKSAKQVMFLQGPDSKNARI